MTALVIILALALSLALWGLLRAHRGYVRTRRELRRAEGALYVLEVMSDVRRGRAA